MSTLHGTQDTEWARSYSTKYEEGRLEMLITYQEDTLLSHLAVEPIKYGDKTWKRAYMKPDRKYNIGARFRRTNKTPTVIWETIDLACVFDSLFVTRENQAETPTVYSQFFQRKAQDMPEYLNDVLWNGAISNPKVIGLHSTTSAGTIQDPMNCGTVSFSGYWSTESNLRKDLITAETLLVGKEFNAQTRVLVAPSCARAMLTNLIYATDVPISQWMNKQVDLRIVYDNKVDSDACASAFDMVLMDRDSCTFGMTPVVIDNFYDQKDRGYYQDIESYVGVAYNPVLPEDGNTNSGYYRGVAKLSQMAFVSVT